MRKKVTKDNGRVIRVRPETYDRLAKRGTVANTMDDVITGLLDAAEKRN